MATDIFRGLHRVDDPVLLRAQRQIKMALRVARCIGRNGRLVTVITSLLDLRYKTIGTFIFLMFWLDFTGLILMFGAVLNAAIQELIVGAIEEQQALAIPNLLKYRKYRLKNKSPK